MPPLQEDSMSCTKSYGGHQREPQEHREMVKEGMEIDWNFSDLYILKIRCIPGPLLSLCMKSPPVLLVLCAVKLLLAYGEPMNEQFPKCIM